ncbi:MAG: hypothetical protein C5B49_08885 [Bdellovibrio sp.]|nr:MAG: hypothetical protein C5B49_08885 [Bdellovibrio sp.]
MDKRNDLANRIEFTVKNLMVLVEPVKELWIGIETNTIPWDICAGWTVVTGVALALRVDRFLISHTRFIEMYPYYPILYKIYAFSVMTAPLWLWAWLQVKRKRDKLKTLTHAFKNSGLQSNIGRLPDLISDHALDPMIRKMRLTNAGFPLGKFIEQTKAIESNLGIFIDTIKENRERRSVDIIYSHYPMGDEVLYSSMETNRPFEFIVGQTRAHTVTASFKDIPHLMVAGETGGGKSTYLRQLIVHIHLKHKTVRFLLIDLKGGLEFSLFENRTQFVVVPSVLAAIEQLKQINKMLDERMAFLKANQCKDIDSYFKKKEKTRTVQLNRHFIVVDEAAEMFLAGHHAKGTDIQAARAILSRVARQGRACGLHLVVATQRPDSRSLDPQVKANLTGVICFKMMNDSSSIAVLGNGRATDLPKIPGRAIWKNGIEMLEVQTPLLSVEEAERLMGPADASPKEKPPQVVEDVPEKSEDQEPANQHEGVETD